MKTTMKRQIPVLKMGCASCAGTIESAIKPLKGVISANVNYASAMLSVVFFPETISLSEIQKTVRAAGYDLFIEEDTNKETTLAIIQEKKLTTLSNKTIWASVLALPIVIIGMFFMDMRYAK
jgi:P-type Cu2+ transporter